MKILRRCAAAWLLVALASPLLAFAQFPAKSQTYRYQAVNRDLADVLRGFAADQRINMVISPDVPNQAISEQVEKSPAEFLDYITGKYGLVWYFDGTSMHVTRNDTLVTRYFRPRFISPSHVIETMKSLNAYSDRFPFRVLENEKVLIAVGPPRLIEMTEFVLQMADRDNGSAISAQAGLAIIRLHHASAADQTISYNGSTLRVPGVATLLQSLVSGQPISGPVTAFVPQDVSAMKQTLADQNPTGQLPPGTSAQGTSPVPPTWADTGPQTPQGSPPTNSTQPGRDPAGWPGPSPGQPFQPTISADVRMNAILIRDHPDRLPAYEALVGALDRPAPLIRITAMIIDVDKSNACEWGLPGTTELGNGDSSMSLSLALNATDTSNLALTLLKDDATAFVQKIKALEQDGKASVVSSPSVLTLDNMEAQLSTDTNFYVRVEGTYAADLYPVSTKTDLTVVPHLIEQNGHRQIRLSVQINDGNVLTQTLEEIPYTRNDSITTQAVLRENESLLIGGMSREELAETESRIPVLGKLPYVGGLFTTKEKNWDHKQRLILIEPQLVACPTADGEQKWLAPASQQPPNVQEMMQQTKAPYQVENGKRPCLPHMHLGGIVPPWMAAHKRPPSDCVGFATATDAGPAAPASRQTQVPANRPQTNASAGYLPAQDHSSLRQAVYDDPGQSQLIWSTNPAPTRVTEPAPVRPTNPPPTRRWWQDIHKK